MADDEWIPPWKFEKLSYFSEGPSLPLRNPALDLNQLQPGDWIQQDRSTVVAVVVVVTLLSSDKVSLIDRHGFMSSR